MFKILVVDDERHIRNGIVSLIQWEELQCMVVESCSNGLEAIDYLKANPVDIVVTDIKMPGMDGLQVSEYIKHHKPETKVILLTAYANFENAQQAIKHNVAEYVVKTEFIQELPIAIENVKKSICENRVLAQHLSHLSQVIDESKEKLRLKFLFDLMMGHLGDEHIIQKNIGDYQMEPLRFRLFVYEINPLHKLLNESLEEDWQKLDSSAGFIENSFKAFEFERFNIKRNMGVILFYEETQFLRQTDLISKWEDIQMMLSRFMDLSLKFAWTNELNQVTQLRSAYKKGLSQLEKTYYGPLEVDEGNLNRLDEEEIQLRIRNLSGENDYEALKKELYLIFGQFHAKEQALEVSKAIMIRAIANLMDGTGLGQCYRDEFQHDEAYIYGEIHDAMSLQSLYETVLLSLQCINQLLVHHEESTNVLVRKVNQYIFDHYQLPINLNLIAKELHVNSSYLSRLYKKETGENLIDFLNGYRIQMAKKLLKQSNKKIAEIASEVGIEDPAYFTHVFTKYSGYSPKEYKSKMSK